MAQDKIDPWDDTAPQELNEIAGWLWLPLIQLIVNPFYLVWLLYRGYSEILARAPGHGAAVATTLFLVALPWFAFVIFCLVRFLQKRRVTRVLMIVFYGLSVGALLIGFIAPASFTQELAARSLVAGHLVPSLIQAALGIALIGYFLTSERVKQTFVVAAEPRAKPSERAGIGGWLLAPLAFQLLWCALSGSAVYWIVLRLWAWHQGGVKDALFHSPFFAAVNACLFVFSVYCLVRFLQRKRKIAPLMTAFYGFIVFHLLARIIATLGGYAGVPAVNGTHEIVIGAILILICAALTGYFHRSRRVKNTFVR